jgi:hypothetical protein
VFDTDLGMCLMPLLLLVVGHLCWFLMLIFVVMQMLHLPSTRQGASCKGRTRAAAVVVQSCWRRALAKRLLQQHKAAVVLQSWVRGHRVRQQLRAQQLLISRRLGALGGSTGDSSELRRCIIGSCPGNMNLCESGCMLVYHVVAAEVKRVLCMLQGLPRGPAQDHLRAGGRTEAPGKDQVQLLPCSAAAEHALHPPLMALQSCCAPSHVQCLHATWSALYCVGTAGRIQRGMRRQHEAVALTMMCSKCTAGLQFIG